MPARFKALVLDALDHQALADWWCTTLGYLRREPPAGEAAHSLEWPVPIYDPRGQGPVIWINPVPEPKTAKNRMHVDVYGHTEEMLALGATLVRRHRGRFDWDVLADPEGNEFCVFSPPKPHMTPAAR
ncbi:VOC family protein [Streptomyces sp. N2-109]|uniref:VOC family protein n=1 Tax=Streptomyces gossypii TaxID=2883101 RepID=A0ABT2JUV7_9ACTN|nr:VOC family protein [Streptomyces gossypii]MCT2591453.1 VOC family protein [Streptomyces gossypii]